MTLYLLVTAWLALRGIVDHHSFRGLDGLGLGCHCVVLNLLLLLLCLLLTRVHLIRLVYCAYRNVTLELVSAHLLHLSIVSSIPVAHVIASAASVVPVTVVHVPSAVIEPVSVAASLVVVTVAVIVVVMVESASVVVITVV